MSNTKNYTSFGEKKGHWTDLVVTKWSLIYCSCTKIFCILKWLGGEGADFAKGVELALGGFVMTSSFHGQKVYLPPIHPLLIRTSLTSRRNIKQQTLDDLWNNYIKYLKNPAYGRHWLSRPMRIIGPDF